MNLKKEISEFYTAYKEANVLVKVLLILGFFLNLSSLTSLSSIIVEWKGFILEGIKFYQSFFVEPILSGATIVGLNYTNIEIHVATVTSVCFVIVMRIQAMGQKVAFRKINERYKSDIKPNLTFYLIMAIVLPIGIWFWYGIADPTIYPLLVTFAVLFFPSFVIIPKIMLSKVGYEYFEKNDFSYFKSYYIHLLTLLIIIGVFAAINLGLNTEIESSNSKHPTINTLSN